jgi:hypothetical protein
MHTPHRSRFRAIVSTACCAVLGAGLPAGAGASATAATSAQEAAAGAKAAPGAKAAGSKVIGYFTEWGHLRPQVLRQEHRDVRLGGQAHAHQLRLRQRHRRQVRDG